jgi:hypothetical protein
MLCNVFIKASIIYKKNLLIPIDFSDELELVHILIDFLFLAAVTFYRLNFYPMVFLKQKPPESHPSIAFIGVIGG